MASIEGSLNTIMKITGAIGCALVDYESGFCLGKEGGGDRLNLDVAAAGNTEVVRAKMRVMKDLHLNDKIEDILISLGKHYHIIRPLESHPQLFLYVAIDREKGNLALARHHITTVERQLQLG